MDLANASSLHRALNQGRMMVYIEDRDTTVPRLSLSVQTEKPAITVKLEALSLKWVICKVEREITFSSR